MSEQARVVRFWRLTFTKAGLVRAVVPLKGPGHSRWVVVEAADEAEARRLGFNMYCARKKRERKERCHAEGKCVCGRKQDRLIMHGTRAGQHYATCSVCSERRHTYHENAKEHPGRTFDEAMADRDESARLAANLGRQRDRRAELRLETLVEVRERWRAAPNVGRFGRWLESEIQSLTRKAVAA